jgi:hypothetical protein
MTQFEDKLPSTLELQVRGCSFTSSPHYLFACCQLLYRSRLLVNVRLPLCWRILDGPLLKTTFNHHGGQRKTTSATSPARDMSYKRIFGRGNRTHRPAVGYPLRARTKILRLAVEMGDGVGQRFRSHNPADSRTRYVPVANHSMLTLNESWHA